MGRKSSSVADILPVNEQKRNDLGAHHCLIPPQQESHVGEVAVWVVPEEVEARAGSARVLVGDERCLISAAGSAVRDGNMREPTVSKPW